MNVRVWHKIGNWNLRISVSLSLVIHLIFILSASVLFSGVRVRQPALRYVKVTLHPVEEEKKTIPEGVSPLASKGAVKRPEKREVIPEEKRVESRVAVPKDEIKPPVPLPVQGIERESMAEEPRPIPPPHEEEGRAKEAPALMIVASLGTDLSLKKEESPSPPFLSSHPGPMEGNKPSGTASEEGTGKRERSSREGEPANGSGQDSGGFSWKGLGDEAGRRQGGPPGGGFGAGTGSQSGSGSGAGTGSGQGDPRGGGSKKGTGFFAKLFSSSGGTAGGLPRYAENPKPPYPQEAREKGHQGEVLLRVEVLLDGRVGQIEIRRSSGHAVLDRSALSAVKQWKFIPAQRGEAPVPSWVNIPIKFQLQ